VKKFLEERPEEIVGISVPGMRDGFPGMGRTFKEENRVVVFNSKGKVELYEIRK